MSMAQSGYGVATSPRAACSGWKSTQKPQWSPRMPRSCRSSFSTEAACIEMRVEGPGCKEVQN